MSTSDQGAAAIETLTTTAAAGSNQHTLGKAVAADAHIRGATTAAAEIAGATAVEAANAANNAETTAYCRCTTHHQHQALVRAHGQISTHFCAAPSERITSRVLDTRRP